ncbi:MAG TPA: 50S ribosomal protein L4 [Crenotrichaceae bacterium]|nr:50S ribosomal protein L4 [Crenotrichaceae bacterium]
MNVEISNYSQDGLTGKKTNVSEKSFNRPINETLIHQLVIHYLAGARSGTSAQKSRSEVAGGGKKPWRQKGTGRARAGTSSSPIWRSGGVTFASKTRDHKTKLNKKMHRAALQCIFSELIRADRLLLGEGLFDGNQKNLRARDVSDSLAKLNARRKVLLLNKVDENYRRATNNIPNLDVFDVNHINPALLVSADVVIVNSEALEVLEGRFV